MNVRFKILLAGLVASLSLAAQADDFESAVPLTIDGLAKNPPPTNLSVSLNGDQVDFSGDLKNTTGAPQTYGFFAYTPMFHRLGEADAYDDRRFSNLTVWLDAQPVKVAADRRAFFLGKDISASVRASGLDPLPDASDYPKAVARIPPQFGIRLKDGLDWQGFVSYSWTATVLPATTRTLDIRYMALPQFSLEDIASPRFSRLVRQHCGNEEQIARQIEQTAPGAASVVVQRYVIPVSYIDRTAFRLSIAQPEKNSLGAHPVLTLACGLTDDRAKTLPVSGTLQDTDNPLSILIIAVPTRQ